MTPGGATGLYVASAGADAAATGGAWQQAPQPPAPRLSSQRRTADARLLLRPGNAGLQVMKSTQNPHQRLRMGDLDSTVVLDPTTNRLLKYSEYEPPVVTGPPGAGGGARRGGPVKLDTALFSERDAVQVRRALVVVVVGECGDSTNQRAGRGAGEGWRWWSVGEGRVRGGNAGSSGVRAPWEARHWLWCSVHTPGGPSPQRAARLAPPVSVRCGPLATPGDRSLARALSRRCART